MLLSHHQKAGGNDDIKIAIKPFGNVAEFRYMGMAITNKKFDSLGN
jgi:hypothetical protein